MSKKNSFLNTKPIVDLPSNLLNIKRQNVPPRRESAELKHTKFLQTSNRYFRTIETPAFVGEKNSSAKQKQVLYKRLSNIRGQNKQIRNLSFSKMLSRMVVLDQDDVQQQLNHFQPRMRQTLHVTPIPQKLYSIDTSNPNSRAPSRSIDLQETDKPSRKLFKKYYMPSSEATQTYYRQTTNPGDKYIYRDGKKVQCKRIHNFYTSHMFRNGYDKCFRKTISSFKVPV